VSTGKLLVRLTAAVTAVAVVVWLLASLIVPPASRSAAAFGAGIAAGWQALVFAATITAFHKNRLAAFGVGMLARLILVAAAGLVIVPAMGIDPAPALLSMVTVLFATTVIEPVLFAGAGNETGR
jgi:hypothetical protein